MTLIFSAINTSSLTYCPLQSLEKYPYGVPPYRFMLPEVILLF